MYFPFSLSSSLSFSFYKQFWWVFTKTLKGNMHISKHTLYKIYMKICMRAPKINERHIHREREREGERKGCGIRISRATALYINVNICSSIGWSACQMQRGRKARVGVAATARQDKTRQRDRRNDRETDRLTDRSNKVQYTSSNTDNVEERQSCCCCCCCRVWCWLFLGTAAERRRRRGRGGVYGNPHAGRQADKQAEGECSSLWRVVMPRDMRAPCSSRAVPWLVLIKCNIKLVDATLGRV